MCLVAFSITEAFLEICKLIMLPEFAVLHGKNHNVFDRNKYVVCVMYAWDD